MVNKLQKIIKETLTQMNPEEKKAIGETNKYIDAQIKQVTSPWFRFFLTFDPKTALVNVKCPVLAINGELDLQVSPQENLAAIEAALKAGGNIQVTTKILPQLNHLQEGCLTAPRDHTLMRPDWDPHTVPWHPSPCQQ